MTGPFSLGQAEDILAARFCPVRDEKYQCGWPLGTMNPETGRKMCAHQCLASEVVRKHRKLAEENATFQTAAELLEAIA